MESENNQQQPSAMDMELDQQGQTQSIFGFINKYRDILIKILKGIFLLLLVGLILMMILSSFDDVLLKAKLQNKYKSHDVKQISGLDEQAYRTYFYYKQMINIAKKNIQKGIKFDATVYNQFDKITFNQLFGIFKVVKAIQFAKNYSAFSQIKQQEVQQLNIDPQILQKPYNYTDYFLPAANQYQCSSCYSFPIIATIQFLYKKHYNISVKLSQQQIIDCSAQDQAVDGCQQGNITKGFEYALKVGLVQQDNYPYRSKNGHSFPCRKQVVDNPQFKKYKIDGFNILPKQNCQAIQYELSKGNVIASMISHGQLNQYTSVQTNAFRNCPKDRFDHAITIVGQTQKQDWIIRNSWGSSWGKNGYFIMRGNNTCGVCTHSIVPYLNITNNSTDNKPK